MDIVTKAQAGTMQSSDLMVTVEPADELSIEIESKVSKQFEHLLRAKLVAVLEESGTRSGRICVSDRGARDYAIEARLQTALQRARGL